MNTDISKFEELVKNDAGIQEKLVAAAESFQGDAEDMKAIFESILLPVAKDAGFSATYEEFEEYITAKGIPVEGELSEDELAQIAGGKGAGLGAGGCLGIGLGIGGGGAGDSLRPVNGGLCALLGIGYGGYACALSGEPETL